MNTERAATIIGVFGIAILGLGYIHLYGFTAQSIVSDLYANFGSEFIGIAITVLVIDFLSKRRQEEELKRGFIRDMGSDSNAFAIRGVRELKAHGKANGGWLRDGSLHNAILLGANLSDAPLEGASLCDVDLTGAQLKGAFLADAKLKGANLSLADLSDANLEAADLRETDLRGASLRNSILQGADLSGAKLNDTILDGVKFDKSTLWPEKFNLSNL